MQAGGNGESAAGHAAATYRGMRSRRGTAALGEINVTPLVDVVLVLLLVFMVTAPMMSRGIDVSLPVANQPQIEPETRTEVTINAKEQIFIDSRGRNCNLVQAEAFLTSAAFDSLFIPRAVGENTTHGFCCGGKK